MPFPDTCKEGRKKRKVSLACCSWIFRNVDVRDSVKTFQTSIPGSRPLGMRTRISTRSQNARKQRLSTFPRTSIPGSRPLVLRARMSTRSQNVRKQRLSIYLRTSRSGSRPPAMRARMLRRIQSLRKRRSLHLRTVPIWRGTF